MRREYKVIVGQTLAELVMLVNQAMALDWEPYGGVAMYGLKLFGTPVFYQAVIR